jgi:hypothetical protein
MYKHMNKTEQAHIALYVYRQMDKIDWRPFIKAAIERNPVCFTDLNGKSAPEVYQILTSMPDESIYEGKRLSLPDEVWNFKRGDGIEKALLLADFIHHKDNSLDLSIKINDRKVTLKAGSKDYHFVSHKNLTRSVEIKGKEYVVV